MKLFRIAVGTLSELAVLLPVILAYAVLMYLHPQLGLSPVLYMAYALAFIFLPSYACSRLLPQKDLGVAERVCLGFPVSQALLFLLAWGGSRLGLSWWGALALPALGLFGLWELLRTRGHGQRSEPFFLVTVTALTTVSLALCFRYFIQTKLPGEGAYYSVYGDDAMMIVWIFSAIKGLLSGLPFMEGSIGDLPFTYHIELHVNNAVAHLVTGIHPMLLQLYVYPVLHWSMLAGAVVAGARRFAGFDRKQTVLAAVLLLYTAGLSFESLPTGQMFGYFHTYFFSLPGTFLLSMLLFGVLVKRMPSLPGLYWGLLFLGVCSAKSVPLVLLPLSLVPVLGYRLFRRQLGMDDLKCAMGILVSALVLRTIEYASAGHLVAKKINILNSSLVLFSNFMEAAPFLLVVGIIAAQDRLTAHRIQKARPYAIFIFSMFATCVVLTRTIDFVGGYQYFYWYFRVFFLAYVAYGLSFAFQGNSRKMRAAALAVIMSAVLAFAYAEYRDLRYKKSIEGMALLSQQEWSGLLWAYDNLDHSAFIISNGMSYRPKPGLPLWGSFDDLAVSGLYGYTWPSDWREPGARQLADNRLIAVNAFWKASSAEERQRLLAALPVDYMFVRKREDRGLDYTGVAGARRIYSNEDFDIYALRGASPQN